MRSRARVVTHLLLSIFVLLSASVWSQVATTSLKGTVTDPKGAVLPGATVILNNPATGFSRTTTTDAQGTYQFLQIPPATYNLTVTASGFATTKANSVQLLVNTPGTQNFKLEVAKTTEIVEVEAQAELVNTQDASLGNAFGSKQLLNLPSEGRDPVWILSLQPGVTYVGGANVDQSYDSRGGSVDGARSDQTNVTLDGVDNNDVNNGNAFQGALRTTLDSIEEFRVATSNSNADQGRSSGAQVSLVTKSGTNQFHGTAYEYNRSNIGEANDWFNEQAQLRSGLSNTPPHLIRNTFGGTVGGPIIKDKLFFFMAYEGQRTNESLEVSRTVPSTLFRNGTLQYLTGTGDLVQLSPSQVTQMDLLGIGANSAAQQLFNQYPTPNGTNCGDGLNFVCYTFPASTPSNLNTYIVKLDANLGSRQTVYVRGNLQNDNLVDPLVANAQQFPGQRAGISDQDNAKGIAVGDVWTISNNVINNFRYGYTRPSTSYSGLQTQPYIEFRGLDNVVGETPTSYFIPPVHNVIDDVSWRKGNHTLQFGGNWRIINDIRSNNSLSFLGGYTNPSWIAGSGYTCGAGCAANGFDPTQIGQPAVGGSSPTDSVNFVQSYDLAVSSMAAVISEGFSDYNRTKTGAVLPVGVPAFRHFKSNEFESYLQDAWHMRPNLTLTLGARYTLLQPPYETSGTQVGLTTSIHDWFNQRAAAMAQGQTYAPLLTFDLDGQANGKSPYWAWDYKNIAPRVAFAWAPNGSGSGWLSRLLGGGGQTSVRGGFGMYYDHYGEGIVNSFDQNGSFGLTTSLSNPAGILSAGGGGGSPIAPRFTGLNNIPSSVIIPAPAGSFPQTPPSTLSTGGYAITWGMDNKIQTPYSEVFDLSVTRQLSTGFVVEASYIGRLGHHLLQEEDLAMPLNLVDPASKTSYFQAASMLSQAYNSGTNINNLAPIPYWQNLFPGAAGMLGFGPPGSSGNLGCAPGDNANATNYTATQAIYDMWSCYVGNETSALFNLDVPDICLPSCSALGPDAYFDPQFSSLYAWRSIGNSAYNGLQVMLRHKGNGLDFDLNYTYSKSIDVGSNAERINEFQGSGFASQVINSWAPAQLRAPSDFDTTQQLNANWVYELPLGKGKHFAGDMHGVGQAVLGGWSLTGIFRITSGYPFTVEPGLGYWATNWQLTSAMFTLKKPVTGHYTDVSGNPNVFNAPGGDPTNLEQPGDYFRFALPGESGERNNLRGPGFSETDAGLAKMWNITEHQDIRFSWEVFNVFNTPSFDVGLLQNGGNNSFTTGSTFGEFQKTMAEPRIMQFSLRFSF